MLVVIASTDKRINTLEFKKKDLIYFFYDLYLISLNNCQYCP